MTIDELLDLARDTLANRAILPSREADLSAAIIDLFGEDVTCGLPEPEAYPHEVYITREMVGRWQPNDAKALGVLLLRAAEKSRQGV